MKLLFAPCSDPHGHTCEPVWFSERALGKGARKGLSLEQTRERNLHIILSVLHGHTLRAAADEYGLTASRVRDIVLRFCCLTMPSVNWHRGSFEKRRKAYQGWLLRAARIHEADLNEYTLAIKEAHE